MLGAIRFGARKWTPGEDTELTALRAGGHTVAGCAVKLGRTKCSIIGHLFRGRQPTRDPASRFDPKAERNANIRRLILAGKTVPYICKELGVTRGVIRNFVQREKLTVRRVAKRPNVKRVELVVTFRPPKMAATINPDLYNNPVDQLIPEAQRKQVGGLTEHTCRWPIGEPSYEMFFCGAATGGRKTYCPEHHARAYVVG